MTLKTAIKEFGLALAPETTMAILAARSRRLIMRIEEQKGLIEVSQSFCQEFGTVVRSGPFKGISYTDFSCRSRNIIPRLIGSYEDELHSWIEEVIAARYETIINVGMADGYYAVGFAYRCPHSRIIAFDTDRWARRATQKLAERNGMSNVEILSLCTHGWLGQNLTPGSFLLLDCEGYEGKLLDATQVPMLKFCDFIVELHEHAAPGVGANIRAVFAGTHNIREITSRTKASAQYPDLKHLPPNTQQSSIDEGRHGPQQWHFVTRKRVSR